MNGCGIRRIVFLGSVGGFAVPGFWRLAALASSVQLFLSLFLGVAAVCAADAVGVLVLSRCSAECCCYNHCLAAGLLAFCLLLGACCVGGYSCYSSS